MYRKPRCVALDQEGEIVASNKDLRDNLWFDNREMVSFNQADDATENHINCRSEKCRRNQDKHGLNNVRP